MIYVLTTRLGPPSIVWKAKIAKNHLTCKRLSYSEMKFTHFLSLFLNPKGVAGKICLPLNPWGKV